MDFEDLKSPNLRSGQSDLSLMCQRLHFNSHFCQLAPELIYIKLKLPFLFIIFFFTFLKSQLCRFFFFGFERFWGQSLGPNFPSPRATTLALQQHPPLLRKFYPSGNWLSSRCLTSAIARVLVFPSWHQPLTPVCWKAEISSQSGHF